MSFRKEAILWLKDIRLFAFKVPTNRYVRIGWIWVMGMWILFFSVIAWAIFK